ncbi:MAG: hypothetical protein AAF573_18345 [Bacteroidota bacterium]
MKTIQLILTATCLLFLQTTWAHQVDLDWEETLRVQLNQALGSSSFSIEQLDVNTSEKQLTGTGTFFNKSGVGFTVSYESDQKIGFFEATMPLNSKVAVTNSQLVNMAGKNLQDLIPDAIKKSVYLEHFSFHFSKENKKVKQFNLGFNALKNWELFSAAHVEMEQIKVIFQIDNPSEKNKRKMYSTLTGVTKLMGKTLNLSAQLRSKKEELQLIAETGNLNLKSSLRELVGKKSIRGISVPNNIFNLNLDAATLTVAPYQDWLTITSTSNFGNVEVWLHQTKKKRKKKKEYVVTITSPKDFKLSKINKKLKFLDAVDLSGQKIVITSEEKDKKTTSKIPSLSQMSTALKKGCSMVAKLDLTKLKIEHLIGVKNLIVSSPLTSKLDHINLDAHLDTDIDLGKSSKLTGVVFRLKPSPKNFAISLLGVMDTQVDKDLLKFKGGVELVLSDQTINFLAMMKGDWHDPLGARGLRVSNVGMQMGASFTTAPVLLPNIALAGKIKIGKFQGNAAIAFDTRNPSKCMLSAGFNEIVLWDFVDMLMDKKIKRKIPKDMKKALQATYFQDVHLEVVPTAIQVLEKNYDPGFRAGGKMSVAGFNIQGGFDIDYTNGIMANGSCDAIEGKIFKLRGANGNDRPGFIIDLRKSHTMKFAVNGEVSLLGVQAVTDIHIMENGFQFMVGGKIFHLFEGDITAKGGDMTKAEEMYVKVRLKNDFMNFIQKDVAGFVQKSTQGGVSKLQVAYNNLAQAEKAVKGWDKKIKAKKKEIEKKQAGKRKAYNAAKKKLTAAQKEVSKLNKEISKLKKTLKSLHALDPKRAWYGTKIAATEASKLTALGALEVAKKGCDALAWVNKSPDADPQVIALKANKEVALKSVQAAKGGIQVVQKGLGIGGGAVTWILKDGTKGMIDIKSATFEGKLGLLSGGAVKLKVTAKWLGKTVDLKVDFDFNDPVRSIANLSNELMKIK